MRDNSPRCSDCNVTAELVDTTPNFRFGPNGYEEFRFVEGQIEKYICPTCKIVILRYIGGNG